MVEFYVASEERKDLSVVAAFHHTKNAALITKSIYIDATSYASHNALALALLEEVCYQLVF